MKYFKLLISAIFAGLMLCIGCSVFIGAVAFDARFIGSFFFSVALILILLTGTALYTGKIGYVFENKPSFILDLLIIWIGNLIGATGSGYLLRLTRSANPTGAFYQAGLALSEARLNDSYLSLFVLAIFCGMLVFIAVDGFKKFESPFVKIIVVILAIGSFVASGFEHVVADMFFYAFANAWATDFWKVLLSLLVMTAGNSIGSIFVWAALKFIRGKKVTSSGREA